MTDRAPSGPLRRLPYLFGGAEVLDEADTLSGGSDALDYLRDLYGELKHAGYGEHIRFDLGLVHQIDYYTGVVFRGYVEGAGDAVLSGGRYDKLVGAFGRPAQATGFAVDVDAVAALPARRVFRRAGDADPLRRRGVCQGAGSAGRPEARILRAVPLPGAGVHPQPGP